MDFENQKLKDFLADLGSKKPTPGGGAASALTGSSGAALVEMVARLNDARTKKNSGTADLALGLRKKLQGLIRKDARAFEKVRTAYKTRDNKQAKWQSALKGAARSPLEICESCRAAAALARREAPRTSRWLESDRREALILLRAAFESARLNVEINLKGIDDKAFVRSCKRRLRWA